MPTDKPRLWMKNWKLETTLLLTPPRTHLKFALCSACCEGTVLATVLRRGCWFHALIVLVFIFNGVSLCFSSLKNMYIQLSERGFRTKVGTWFLQRCTSLFQCLNCFFFPPLRDQTLHLSWRGLQRSTKQVGLYPEARGPPVGTSYHDVFNTNTVARGSLPSVSPLSGPTVMHLITE